MVFEHKTSSHMPLGTILTQSCLSLVVASAAGWLSFHAVNCPSVHVMSAKPKLPPVLVKVVSSEKV